MTKGTMQKIELRVVNKVYKLYFIDGKYDSLEVHTQFGNQIHKEKYQRWENEQIVREVIYMIGKQDSISFKEIYRMFEKNDPKFYEITSKILEKIKSEYNF
ncbi:MAG: hypothetical protein IKT41_00165 [Clostridia bacterium]|nr:hypothetical protein [Clostridia bacterium]